MVVSLHWSRMMMIRMRRFSWVVVGLDWNVRRRSFIMCQHGSVMMMRSMVVMVDWQGLFVFRLDRAVTVGRFLMVEVREVIPRGRGLDVERVVCRRCYWWCRSV